jgi:Outer membrane protein beta-barrel domain
MSFRGLARSVFVGAACVASTLAQSWISVGVKGGVPLTDPFADRTFNYVIATIPNPFGPPWVDSEATRTYSGSKGFVLGPTLEMQLPLGLAIEADALYRPMSVKTQSQTFLEFFEQTGPIFSSQINTWEFPVMAKYRLPLPLIKPYVEAGPSFRAISASLADHMSATGVAAGVGVEMRFGPLRVAPEVRYTHWGSDGSYTSLYHAVSYANQVEFLAGLSTAPTGGGTNARTNNGWRRYVSLGVRGGLPFMTAFVNDGFGKVSYPSTRCGDFSPTACIASDARVQTSRASRNYLIGPSVEVHLPLSLSLEADALYAPVSLALPGLPSLAGFLLGEPSLPTIGTFNSWQFPVMGKYKFHTPFLRPYLDAGPTFRTVPAVFNQYLSHAGVTAGVGAEAAAWKLRIAPEVRFVHWSSDASNTPSFYASRRNQAQFVVGLLY